MELFKGSLFKIIADIFEPIEGELKQVIKNRILEYTAEEYNRSLYVKTILYRTTPVNLFSFYHPLNLREFDDSKPKHIRVLKRVFSVRNVSELFEDKNFISIIGAAGSGKSTLVKYLYINCVESNYKIPLKIEVRYLNDYNDTFSKYVYDEIFKVNKLAVNDTIVRQLLESGKVVFFIDGYDELQSSKKEKTTKELNDFVKLYQNCKYVITSRPYTGIEFLPLFRNYEVCELTENEITQFINKIIPDTDDEVRRKLIEATKDSKNEVLKSFLINPLLLSMFILTYQSYARIPQKVSFFYQYVFDALYAHHDSVAKLAFEREKQSGLSKEEFVEILQLISFVTYFDEKYIFSETYFNELLNTIKGKKENLKFSNEKLLGDLLVAIAILNREGFDLSFPHRSLQEYFAALYVANLSANNKLIAYQKILNKFPLSKALGNFMILLKELDHVSFLKLAVIPEVQSVSRRIDNIHKTAHATYNLFYNDSYNTLRTLNLLSQEDKDDYYVLHNDKTEGMGKAYLNYSCKLKETVIRIFHELSSQLNKYEKEDFDIVSLI